MSRTWLSGVPIDSRGRAQLPAELCRRSFGGLPARVVARTGPDGQVELVRVEVVLNELRNAVRPYVPLSDVSSAARPGPERDTGPAHLADASEPLVIDADVLLHVLDCTVFSDDDVAVFVRLLARGVVLSEGSVVDVTNALADRIDADDVLAQLQACGVHIEPPRVEQLRLQARLQQGLGAAATHSETFALAEAAVTGRQVLLARPLSAPILDELGLAPLTYPDLRIALIATPASPTPDRPAERAPEPISSQAGADTSAKTNPSQDRLADDDERVQFAREVFQTVSSRWHEQDLSWTELQPIISRHHPEVTSRSKFDSVLAELLGDPPAQIKRNGRWVYPRIQVWVALIDWHAAAGTLPTVIDTPPLRQVLTVLPAALEAQRGGHAHSQKSLAAYLRHAGHPIPTRLLPSLTWIARQHTHAATRWLEAASLSAT